jgi:hypothetical protein
MMPALMDRRFNPTESSAELTEILFAPEDNNSTTEAASLPELRNFYQNLRWSKQGWLEGRLDLQTLYRPEGIRQGCQRAEQDGETDDEEGQTQAGCHAESGVSCG